ncbi:uncharacterized protein LOC116196523 isoform X1 [Punica granatum]|uniref:Uncharacterized protein LOC116196523 isoform X1 n=1 Tax=Punica granatum TaxID=22663 RepID=A0A6P8CGA7_PUNGR|nr:uncharacterized protein LOC116196523 isoform X1 [Punica granatum]
MEVTITTTDLSYWLNWRVLLCAVSVLASMFLASFIIWKYDGWKRAEHNQGGAPDRALFLRHDEAWKTCLKQIHPGWLTAFRIISFSLLLTTLTVKLIEHGGHMFFFYTQWTLTLVTVYFGFGSLLSIYGCYQHQKCRNCVEVDNVEIDEEDGSNSYRPLPGQRTTDKCGIKEFSDPQEQKCVLQAAGIFSHLFEVIFQMSAGAVMLTDCVYWFIIFPFLTIRDYTLSFMTVNVHTLNFALLLGDTALNCLQVPWYRISYFILWTSAFVIFQWVLHACFSVWWPYPFLDLSSPYSPLWYFLMGLMHIPCYSIFMLLVQTKQSLYSRFFPDSYMCGR